MGGGVWTQLSCLTEEKVNQGGTLMKQIFRPVGFSRQCQKASDHTATKLKITPIQS